MTNSEKMIACLDRKDLQGADKYFKRALLQDSQETLLELGEYLEAIGFYPQAKDIYEQLRTQYPYVNISLAQMASDDGDTEAAFAYLNDIAETSDDYVTALVVMADLYDTEGLTDVAREKLLLASQLSDDPLITFGLAEIELQLEDYSEAIKHYAQLDNRELLEAMGVSTYERIGRAYACLGKFEPALEFLEKALEIERDDTILYEIGTLYHKQEAYGRAILAFKELDALNPDYPGYEYPYALALHADHQTNQALVVTQQALQKNRWDAQLLHLAAQLSYELHQAEEAERYLKEALVLDDQDERALLSLSNLYLEQERYEDLVALDLSESELILTRWHLAQAYRSLDEEDEALATYQSIASELADNPEFLLDYSQFLRAIGDLRGAYLQLQRYLRWVPDDATAQEEAQDLQDELEDA